MRPTAATRVARNILTAVVSSIAICAWPAAGAPQTKPSADIAIRFLEQRIASDPDDIVALNLLAARYQERFRSTGGDADLERALAVSEQSLKSVPADFNKGGLAARAQARHSLHQFAGAREDATLLTKLDPGKRRPLELLGDAEFELGNYAVAERLYRQIEREFDTDEPLPTLNIRLARLANIHGDRTTAAKHFSAAVELAQADRDRMPEVFAWTCVQAGYFDFSAGRWEQAESRYRDALAAAPDDWPAVDHLAELRAAQKRYDESVSLYTTLVARVPRPELFEALGSVYLEMGKPDQARPWHDRARAGYEQAISHGSGHYYHHLAGFYSDIQPDGVTAVRWAEKDLALRRTPQAHDAVAWAYYQAGRFPDAVESINRALEFGVADAHLLYHASLIHTRAGDPARGRDLLNQAATANPRFMSFHVHR